MEHDELPPITRDELIRRLSAWVRDDRLGDGMLLRQAVAALSSAPPDLVPEHVRKHSREVVDMYRGLKPREQVSRGTLAAMAIGLLERWLARAPETPAPVAPVDHAPMGMPGDAGHDQWGYPLSLRTPVPDQTPVAPAPPVAETPPTRERVWTGPGELERTGYIDPGCGVPPVAPVAPAPVPYDVAMRQLRDVNEDDICQRCMGTGSRVYPSTSVWAGGAGGMTPTRAACDRCWGSGEASKPWPSHRMIAALSHRETPDGEVPPSSTWGDLGPAAKCSRCGDDGRPCSHCETAPGGGR